MKVLMQLENLKKDTDINNDDDKFLICKNLSRIMDIKVEHVDVKNKTISFIYENPKSISKVVDELRRIGYPIKYVIKTTKAKLFKRLDR